MGKINIEPKIGDYVTFDDVYSNKLIFEVLSLENYPKIIVKIIFPKDLAKSLKENKVFSLNRTPLKLLGSPSKEGSLRILYG